MTDSVATGARPARAAGIAAPAGVTRALLACGVVGGPLFLGVVLAQALTRPGFDLSRHPLSLLALGDWGWIQVTNFVLTGALFVACAVGIRRALHPGCAGTWGPLLLGAAGAGLVTAGVFTADPVLGFPPGTPQGLSESTSWHGMLHLVGFVVLGVSLVAATFVLARGFAADGRRNRAAYSVIVGVIYALAVVLALSGAGVAIMVLYAAVLLGWSDRC